MLINGPTDGLFNVISVLCCSGLSFPPHIYIYIYIYIYVIGIFVRCDWYFPIESVANDTSDNVICIMKQLV